MEKDKISVIVPVYKVEEYLPKCLDSIINQTYKNLEIILVDDGSPDGCGKICDEYAEKDSRIMVIHKENEGISSARNTGLDTATGAYIGFVDSDDWIEPDFFEKLYNGIITANADACTCAYWYSYPDGTEIEKASGSNWIYKSSNEIMGHFIGGGHGSNAVFLKLYKKEIFEWVRFNKDIKICEDDLFCFEMSKRISSYAHIDEVLYHYYQNPSSAVLQAGEINEDSLLVADEILNDNVVKQDISLMKKAHKNKSCALFMMYIKALKAEDLLSADKIRKKYNSSERKNVFSSGLSKAMIIRLLMMSFTPVISRLVECANIKRKKV